MHNWIDFLDEFFMNSVDNSDFALGTKCVTLFVVVRTDAMKITVKIITLFKNHQKWVLLIVVVKVEIARMWVDFRFWNIFLSQQEKMKKLLLPRPPSALEKRKNYISFAIFTILEYYHIVSFHRNIFLFLFFRCLSGSTLQSTTSPTDSRQSSEHVPINRSCTDVFFLILNIVFVIILVSCWCTVFMTNMWWWLMTYAINEWNR